MPRRKELLSIAIALGATVVLGIGCSEPTTPTPPATPATAPDQPKIQWDEAIALARTEAFRSCGGQSPEVCKAALTT